MADFNLVGTPTIAINGTDYTKDEILKIIDRLKDVEHLAGHQYIFEQKNLLAWLENSGKGDIPMLEAKAFVKTFETDAFILDILQEALQKNIIFLYHKRRFKDISQPIAIVELLQDYRKAEFYNLIFEELDELCKTIEQASQSPNIRENNATFGFIITPEWTDFLNNLPEELANIRSEYCRCLINYTVSTQKKSRRWTYEVSYQLSQTLCEPELSELIANNHTIYRDNHQNTNKSDASNAWIYWLIYAVLMLLFRVNSCNNKNSSSYDQRNVPVPEQEKTESLLSTTREQNGTSKPSIPGTTFYVLHTQAYQQALTLADSQQFVSQRDVSKLLVNIKNGTNLLAGLSLYDSNRIEVDTTATNRTGQENIVFENKTKFDLLVLRAGYDKNHSFFVKKGTSYALNCCPDDIFNFYFGNNWHKTEDDKRYLKENNYLYIVQNKTPFGGYFSQKHPNSLPIFYQTHTLTQILKGAALTFTEDIQAKTIAFGIKNLSINKDSNINREDILAK